MIVILLSNCYAFIIILSALRCKGPKGYQTKLNTEMLEWIAVVVVVAAAVVI